MNLMHVGINTTVPLVLGDKVAALVAVPTHDVETPVPPTPRAAQLLLGSSMLALLLPLMVNATDVGPRTTGLKAVALLQMLLPHTRNTRN